MTDKQDPRYWRGVKVGDFVSLTDYQSIALAGSEGKDYRVRTVKEITISDKESGRSIAEYRFHELAAGTGGLLYFVMVLVEQEFELRIYFLPTGFSTGTRDHLVDIGQTWFFLPPPDPEDFVSSALEYAPFPDIPPIEEAGGAVEREYGPGGFGQPIYGSYREGNEEVPVIITEYATEDKQALNPLILVLEERWILPDGTIPEEGGFVVPLIGCVVHPDSVETYAA